MPKTFQTFLDFSWLFVFLSLFISICFISFQNGEIVGTPLWPLPAVSDSWLLFSIGFFLSSPFLSFFVNPIMSRVCNVFRSHTALSMAHTMYDDALSSQMAKFLCVLRVCVCVCLDGQIEWAAICWWRTRLLTETGGGFWLWRRRARLASTTLLFMHVYVCVCVKDSSEALCSLRYTNATYTYRLLLLHHPLQSIPTGSPFKTAFNGRVLLSLSLSHSAPL